MEAISFSSSTLSGRWFSTKPSCRRRLKIVANARREKNGRDYRGKLVDENMIILRMRLREMKMVETNHVAPPNWMEWEKRYFSHYNEDVCEAVGLLQSYLMSTRPCLALGLMVLFALSVPISAWVLVFNAMEMAKGVLFSGFHLG